MRLAKLVADRLLKNGHITKCERSQYIRILQEAQESRVRRRVFTMLNGLEPCPAYGQIFQGYTEPLRAYQDPEIRDPRVLALYDGSSIPIVVKGV